MRNPVTNTPTQSQIAKWVEMSARIGYAAKGIVYFLVGLLAVQAALNWGGKVTGTKGALQAVASQPFGKIILFGIAVGLVCYVAWHLIAAVFDPENDNDSFNLTSRLAHGVRACVYGSLAEGAFDIIFSEGSSGTGSSSSSERAATLLAQPFGRTLLSGVAICAVAYGFYCIYRSVTSKFRKSLKLRKMSQTQEQWLLSIGCFGLMAKGFVAIVISYFAGQAARLAEPSKVKSTEDVLQTLQRQPFGAALMGLVAFGLIAYGFHLIMQSRYRRISP
jgi:hypothetical protein